jgi:hypothetical protein
MTARLRCDVCGTQTENLLYPSRNYRGLCDECRNLDWKGKRRLSRFWKRMMRLSGR